MTPESACAGLPLEKTQYVPRHRVKMRSLRKLSLHIREEGFKHFMARKRRARLAIEARIDFGQQIGILIGRATKHRAIPLPEMSFRFPKRGDAAIHNVFQFRDCLLWGVAPR